MANAKTDENTIVTLRGIDESSPLIASLITEMNQTLEGRWLRYEMMAFHGKKTTDVPLRIERPVSSICNQYTGMCIYIPVVTGEFKAGIVIPVGATAEKLTGTWVETVMIRRGASVHFVKKRIVQGRQREEHHLLLVLD